MRTNLKIFRIKQKLSQEKIAEKIGCTRMTYANTENGTRDGSVKFWNKLREAFPELEDTEFVELMKIDEEQETKDGGTFSRKRSRA